MRHNRKTFILLALLCAAPFAAIPKEGVAVDTFEPFAPGLSNAEYYMGVAELGCGASRLSSEAVVGIGLANRFSLHLSAYVDSKLDFSQPETLLHSAIFATPLETGHVSLDVAMSFYFNGPKRRSLQMVPGFELNLDLAPDQSRGGLYLRMEFAFSTGAQPDDSTHNSAGFGAGNPILDTSTAVGVYVTLPKQIQFLTEYRMHTARLFDRSACQIEVEGVALGLNIPVHPLLEVITEIFASVPHERHPFGVGAMAGVIVSVP